MSASISTMQPKIITKKDDDNLLQFTIEDTPLSAINALRRIIVSEIPIVGFKTAPHDESDCTIHVNTTRLNNEILKHRLACIPVHIKDDLVTKTPSIPLGNYELVVKKKNTGSDIVYITTEDFQILDKNTKQFLSKSDRDSIFPANDITGDHIDFARLRPKVGSHTDGEELSLTCNLSVLTPKKNGCMYNSTTKCFFTNTIDAIARNDRWEERAQEIKKSDPDANMEFEKRNWMALEGNRHFKPKSYDFQLKTIGVYENAELLNSACNVMIQRLKNIKDNFATVVKIEPSMATLPSSYDIDISNEDYTVGKVLEDFIFDMYVQTNRVVYAGFIKEHPHANSIKYRIAFGSPVETVAIEQLINVVIDASITLFENMRVLF